MRAGEPENTPASRTGSIFRRLRAHSLGSGDTPAWGQNPPEARMQGGRRDPEEGPRARKAAGMRASDRYVRFARGRVAYSGFARIFAKKWPPGRGRGGPVSVAYRESTKNFYSKEGQKFTKKEGKEWTQADP